MEIIGSVISATNRHGWMAEGLCRSGRYDPDLWFPDNGRATRATNLCSVCPVLDRCFEFVVEERPRFGVWASLSEGERKRMGLRDEGLGGQDFMRKKAS